MIYLIAGAAMVVCGLIGLITTIVVSNVSKKKMVEKLGNEY